MPIIKKNEPIGTRPVIIFIYGEPGIGKTSLFNTSASPLLVDFDRGVDRSILRQDTLVVRNWEDVQAEEKAGTFKSYKTVGIDTAKAALDDFLMSYVVKADFKNQKNKLAAYGAIGDEFKLFINNRRQEDADIVIIAHAKDEKEGDTIRKVPDVTGQSYQLLLRISDQVGYVRTVNNKRTIQFEPSDNTVGKNVARLPLVEIPNEGDASFKDFMATVIGKVKDAINSQSEAQREAVALSEEYQAELAKCKEPDEFTDLLTKINDLPAFLGLPLKKFVGARAKELGFIPNKETKRFEKPALPADNAPATSAEPGKTPAEEIIPTDFDQRCKMLENAGAILQSDQFTYGKDSMTYDALMELGEDQFSQLVLRVGDAVKTTKKPTYRRNQAQQGTLVNS